jgi:hypothetical protein
MAGSSPAMTTLLDSCQSITLDFDKFILDRYFYYGYIDASPFAEGRSRGDLECERGAAPAVTTRTRDPGRPWTRPSGAQ